MESVEGIADVSAYEELASGFITLRNVATVICVALIAILFVVSVFITSNTIKLTTFDRREEIASMRMVGATNGFIRWPFVYEGFMLGRLSAIIAFLLQWAAVAGTFAGAGILIGVGGSLSAIRKFLQV